MLRLLLALLIFAGPLPARAMPRGVKVRAGSAARPLSGRLTTVSPASRLGLLQKTGLSRLSSRPDIRAITAPEVLGLPSVTSLPPAALPALSMAAPKKSLAAALTPVPASLAAPDKDATAGELKEGLESDWAQRTGEGPLNIVIAGAESVPYIKTGGLADVIDALARGFADKGHKTTIFLPMYEQIDAEAHGLTKLPGEFDVPVGDRIEKATLWHTRHGGADAYFIDNPNVYSEKSPYSPSRYGAENIDDRFIFFSRAVLEAVKHLQIQPDIIQAHDWHAALIPAFMNLLYSADPFFFRTATIQTIHNIAFQGFFPYESMIKAGFPASEFAFDRLEYYGNFSFLKAGLVHADAITTVSPTYAREIQENEDFGHGLQGLLAWRKKDVHGILNGLDRRLHDPATDPLLAVNYDVTSVTEGKRAAKRALQKAAGFEQNDGTPLFGIASRLASQKGIDLIVKMMPWLRLTGAQLVISGSGESNLEDRIDQLAKEHPKHIFRHPFSTTFVHSVFAGSDFLLMPSRFEPCGLSQLIAMLYGTLPIATYTGGLKDTITGHHHDPANSNGMFLRDFSVESLVESVTQALALFNDKKAFDLMRLRAMVKDVSWDKPLDEYLELFRKVLVP